VGLLFRRRVITGRVEDAQLSFLAIPGRAGIRLDGLDLNPIRMGMGQMFPPGPPAPRQDPPPYLRWVEQYGPQLEAALNGELPEVLPGEGSLLARHRAWSLERAAKLILAPRKAGVDRKLVRERKRLERLGAALAQDRARHGKATGLKDKANRIAAELYRLKGCAVQVELLDGTLIPLPEGQRAEEAAQRWFHAAKRAERGLARVAELEEELRRQLRELEAKEAAKAAGTLAPPARPVKPPSKQGRKPMEKADKRKDGRADGKGRAFRSVVAEGFEILIGKGDADNDQLTFKVAEPLDLWFHVANTPGSHVVIRNPERISELPRAVVERAAELAAFFSKARDGGKVEVHYCRAADVSKPRGFPAGKVMLKQWKSLRVYPKE
jgi:predicted ribosome quality control (RQC) complex YloA/Tae2 family protein